MKKTLKNVPVPTKLRLTLSKQVLDVICEHINKSRYTYKLPRNYTNPELWSAWEFSPQDSACPHLYLSLPVHQTIQQQYHQQEFSQPNVSINIGPGLGPNLKYLVSFQ